MVEQDQEEQYTYLQTVSWLLAFVVKTYPSFDAHQDNLDVEDMK
jgi:hypothetical protein